MTHLQKKLHKHLFFFLVFFFICDKNKPKYSAIPKKRAKHISTPFHIPLRSQNRSHIEFHRAPICQPLCCWPKHSIPMSICLFFSSLFLFGILVPFNPRTLHRHLRRLRRLADGFKYNFPPQYQVLFLLKSIQIFRKLQNPRKMHIYFPPECPWISIPQILTNFVPLWNYFSISVFICFALLWMWFQLVFLSPQTKKNRKYFPPTWEPLFASGSLSRRGKKISDKIEWKIIWKIPA